MDTWEEVERELPGWSWTARLCRSCALSRSPSTFCARKTKHFSAKYQVYDLCTVDENKVGLLALPARQWGRIQFLESKDFSQVDILGAWFKFVNFSERAKKTLKHAGLSDCFKLTLWVRGTNLST